MTETDTKPDGYYQLLSPRQVSERLGCSKGTVYKLINDGTIVSVLMPHGTKVRESDLRGYIDAQVS